MALLHFHFTLATLTIYGILCLSSATPSILPSQKKSNSDLYNKIARHLVADPIVSRPNISRDFGNVPAAFETRPKLPHRSIPWKNSKMMWFPHDKGGYVPAFLEGSPPKKSYDTSSMFVKVYTVEYPNVGQTFSIYDYAGIQRALHSGPDYKTVLYAHGFTGSWDSSIGLPCKDEIYKQYWNYNVIICDWSSLAAAPWYDDAAASVVDVGEAIAKLFCYLSKSGCIPLDNVHLVGHSLGAHVVGCAGMHLQNLCGEKFGRITGTDPAGPLFAWNEPWRGLDSTDAYYVDSIHTDCGGFGCDWYCGHADFFPNGGYGQWQCDWSMTVGCSHNMAREYLRYSICDRNYFQASRADGFSTGAKSQMTATMGHYCPYDAEGAYMLSTSGEPPYSMS